MRTLDPPLAAPAPPPQPKRNVDNGWLAIAGAASLGAGAIHAAAIGVHSEHRQAVWAFTLVAAFQIVAGVLALTRPSRWLAVVLSVGSAALVGGWFLAKTGGIGFVDGLETTEAVQFADGAAALLAGISMVTAAAAAGRLRSVGNPGAVMVGLTGVLVMVFTVPAMVAAGSHSHAGSHSQTASGDHAHTEAVVAPKEYDATKPVDLSGVSGVSSEQQARAEALVERSLDKLPQFADEATLNAKGFYSIGDATTGDEHYINWSYLNDDKILDPDYPESLVFHITNGHKQLAAAMYMLPEGTSLDNVPDVGGPLTQWHVHNDLCLTDDPVKPVLAFGSGNFLVGANEACTPPSVKKADVPMIHVWIIPHPCGPFAALEGVGAGQIKPGEERLCDEAHGSSS